MGKPKGKQGGPSQDTEETLLDQGKSDKAEAPQDPMKQQVDLILAAIADIRRALQQDIPQVAAGLGLLRADHAKLSDRVKCVEVKLEEMEPTQKALETKMSDVLRRVHTLEKRAEDAEGRNNIRVVTLPEGVEGTAMVEYLENWLKTMVATAGLSPFYTLERAHRVPACPPVPGHPPRPVVARLLHYTDRDLLLRKARAEGPYQVANGKVTLFPDYTFDVQRRRSSFLAVKKELQSEGLQYSRLFPARLRISTHFCDSPEEAWDWLEAYRSGTGKSGRPLWETAGRTGLRRSQRTRRRRQEAGKPTASQTEAERMAALQAVAELSGKRDMHSTVDTDSGRDKEQSDTEESETGSVSLPQVTPGTADELVDA